MEYMCTSLKRNITVEHGSGPLFFFSQFKFTISPIFYVYCIYLADEYSDRFSQKCNTICAQYFACNYCKKQCYGSLLNLLQERNFLKIIGVTHNIFISNKSNMLQQVKMSCVRWTLRFSHI